jgi:hypothetical protein
MSRRVLELKCKENTLVAWPRRRGFYQSLEEEEEKEMLARNCKGKD